jgi:ERCC4-related helicase
MPPEARAVSTGTLVRVRQRTYLVESVLSAEGAASVVQLACVDDDAQGQRLDVIWDAETDARVIRAGRSALKATTHPDDPRTFAAYLHALRWGCVTSTDPTLFQAPLRAGIVPKSYQLEPLRKALALPRVNLFIADDVGLGKTIEAGLVLQELLLRQRVQRVVVSCPSSVVLQWRDELAQRFGLSFVVFDKAFIQARRRERGFGVNAWTTHRHFIISHALLRDEDYLVGLREWLGGFAPGSLLILDEAHAAAPSSESKYAIDSQTTRAVRDIAKRFEHRLFLSATPHNGHSNSFSALLEILDPQRFTRGVPVTNSAALKPVMVRRLKGELRNHLASEIPERKTIQIDLNDLPLDTPELVLAEKLAEYTEILERRLAGATNRTKAAGKLVTIALQKRLLSSIEAFARTLAVHRRNAVKTGLSATQKKADVAPAPRAQAALFALDDDGSDLTEEQTSELDEVEVARATKAGASAEDDARAKTLLDEMTALADASRDLPDAKIRALVDFIRSNQCHELPPLGAKVKGRPTWEPKRVLIFTEYAHTKEYLVHQLEAAIAGTDRADERVLSLHGGMQEEDREYVKEAFNDAKHPVRILIGTDAAREGVNLQAQCANLFHFDLPWNPGRMEQRNGRIDRTLQPEPVVRCHYFVYGQRPEDRVLEALVKKTAVIQAQLGSLADVLEKKLARALDQGIPRASAKDLIATIASSDAPAAADPRTGGDRAVTAEEELERVRTRDTELKTQLDDLDKLQQKARDHLDLRADRLHDVVNLGLALAEVPGLAPRAGHPGTYDVPSFDKLAGADGTWRDIVDTLRPPKTKKMPDWEWRAKCSPRPVSFEPSTTLAAETVQLHLQHKLTQRALWQFRSQAFGEEKLARVAIVSDPSHSRKRVLALAKLSVYGMGASRLHEELLVVASFWSEGDDPARLEPFKTADAEEKALESLSNVLAKEGSPAVPEHIVKMLMAGAARDEDALWGKVTARAEQRIAFARERLEQRAKVEAEEMARILQSQRAAIEKELSKRQALKDDPRALQVTMPWLPEEQDQKAQYEADTRHIAKRRAEVERELETEPQRIRDLYAVQHHRLERVGLVYLWPTTS